MAIRMRRGLESELDISKAVPGEWLVSTDTRYVRMCFAPGIVLRMATYEAFEADSQKFIEQMEQILSETKTVQEAVERIQNEIEDSVITVENYVESAKGYSNLSNTYAMQSKMYAEESNNYADDSYNEAERAKMYAENAEAVTNVKIASQTEAGLMRGGENYVAEDGTLQLTAQTTDSILKNSHAGSIKINEVLGNCEQTQYTGRNLIPYPYYETTHEDNGITFTDNGDGSVTMDGTATGDSQFIFMSRHADTMTLKAGTYTISGGCPEGGSMSTYRTIVSKNDAEGVASNFGYDLGKGLTFDVDGTETAIGVVMFINGGTTVSNLTFRPQLELGSAATDYEPYVGGIPSPNPDYPQEIKSVEVSEFKTVGKNWINLSTLKNINTGITVEEINLDTGYVKVVFENAPAKNACFSYKFSLIDGEKYTFSSNIIATASSGISVYVMVVDAVTGVWVRNYSSGTFVASSEYKYSFVIQNNTGAELSGTIEVDSIQLERGDTVTNYSPYQEKSVTLSQTYTLHGIDDAKDKIVKRDGVWGIERNVARVTLNSDNLKSVSLNNQFGNFASFAFPLPCKDSDDEVMVCANMFIGVSTNKRAINTNTYRAWGDSGEICIRETSENLLFTSKDAIKSFLDENEVIVNYILATPTFESLPVADQIALMSLKTFDTVTYISTDSDIEPVIDVEYGTSRIGGYTLEALNTAQKNEIQYASLATLTNSLATALVAGSEE